MFPGKVSPKRSDLLGAKLKAISCIFLLTSKPLKYCGPASRLMGYVNCCYLVADSSTFKSS